MKFLKQFLLAIVISALFPVYAGDDFLVLGASSQSGAVIAGDSAHHWTLDESSGSRADSIGSATLTEVGGTVGSTSSVLVGNSATFLTADATYLETSDDDNWSLDGSYDWTVFFFFRHISGGSADQWIVGKYDETDVNKCQWFVKYQSATDKFTLFYGGDGDVDSLENIHSAASGTWFLVAVVHDASSNEISLYVGEVNTSTHDMATETKVYPIPNAAVPFTVGSIPGRSQNQCGIDEVYVYPRALTVLELDAYCNDIGDIPSL